MSETFISDLSKKEYPVSQRISAMCIRQPVISLIRKDHPDFTDKMDISLSELDSYRKKYVREYLTNELGELSELDKKVVESINQKTIITDNPIQNGDAISLGERLADKIASFGGSWKFIAIFIGFIFLWILMNAVFLLSNSFDPYPFILMNLILSCLAALQAPVIMMSQNRQAAIDRKHAGEDYMVNLKSELEVRSLHEKMDHMILFQQQKLLEIQQLQVDMLSDIREQLNGKD